MTTFLDWARTRVSSIPDSTRRIGIVAIVLIGALTLSFLPWPMTYTINAQSGFVRAVVAGGRYEFANHDGELTFDCASRRKLPIAWGTLRVEAAQLVFRGVAGTVLITPSEIPGRAGYSVTWTAQDQTTFDLTGQCAELVLMTRRIPVTGENGGPSPAEAEGDAVPITFTLEDIVEVGQGLLDDGPHDGYIVTAGTITVSSISLISRQSFSLPARPLFPGDRIQLDEDATGRGLLVLSASGPPTVVVRQKSDGVLISRYRANTISYSIGFVDRLRNDPLLLFLWGVAFFLWARLPKRTT